MRLATWNVNSIKQRVPRLLPWLDQREPDVVCLQETKLADDAFAELLGEELVSRGYEVATHGEVQWNGVAILSRVGLEEVERGVDGAPGFPHPEARAVSAICGGIRVHSVYVPNGRVPDSDHYRYKLEWLAALAERVRGGPDDAVVCGDMNIAPADEDVFDPEAYIGQTHVTAPEREALAQLQSLGLRDVVRDRWPEQAGLHVLGLPRRHVPPGPGHAHRSGLGQRAGRRASTRGLGGQAGAQGIRTERPCSGDRGPGRGSRRRHRPGGPTAVRAGQAASHLAAEPRALSHQA